MAARLAVREQERGIEELGGPAMRADMSDEAIRMERSLWGSFTHQQIFMRDFIVERFDRSKEEKEKKGEKGHWSVCLYVYRGGVVTLCLHPNDLQYRWQYGIEVEEPLVAVTVDNFYKSFYRGDWRHSLVTLPDTSKERKRLLELVRLRRNVNMAIVDERTLRHVEYFNSLHDVRRQAIARHEVEFRGFGRKPSPSPDRSADDSRNNGDNGEESSAGETAPSPRPSLTPVWSSTDNDGGSDDTSGSGHSLPFSGGAIAEVTSSSRGLTTNRGAGSGSGSGNSSISNAALWSGLSGGGSGSLCGSAVRQSAADQARMSPFSPRRIEAKVGGGSGIFATNLAAGRVVEHRASSLSSASPLLERAAALTRMAERTKEATLQKTGPPGRAVRSSNSSSSSSSSSTTDAARRSGLCGGGSGSCCGSAVRESAASQARLSRFSPRRIDAKPGSGRGIIATNLATGRVVEHRASSRLSVSPLLGRTAALTRMAERTKEATLQKTGPPGRSVSSSSSSTGAARRSGLCSGDGGSLCGSAVRQSAASQAHMSRFSPRRIDAKPAGGSGNITAHLATGTVVNQPAWSSTLVVADGSDGTRNRLSSADRRLIFGSSSESEKDEEEAKKERNLQETSFARQATTEAIRNNERVEQPMGPAVRQEDAALQEVKPSLHDVRRRNMELEFELRQKGEELEASEKSRHLALVILGRQGELKAVVDANLLLLQQEVAGLQNAMSILQEEATAAAGAASGHVTMLEERIAQLGEDLEGMAHLVAAADARCTAAEMRATIAESRAGASESRATFAGISAAREETTTELVGTSDDGLITRDRDPVSNANISLAGCQESLAAIRGVRLRIQAKLEKAAADRVAQAEARETRTKSTTSTHEVDNARRRELTRTNRREEDKEDEKEEQEEDETHARASAFMAEALCLETELLDDCRRVPIYETSVRMGRPGPAVAAGVEWLRLPGFGSRDGRDAAVAGTVADREKEEKVEKKEDETHAWVSPLMAETSRLKMQLEAVHRRASTYEVEIGTQGPLVAEGGEWQQSPSFGGENGWDAVVARTAAEGGDGKVESLHRRVSSLEEWMDSLEEDRKCFQRTASRGIQRPAAAFGRREDDRWDDTGPWKNAPKRGLLANERVSHGGLKVVCRGSESRVSRT